MNTKNIAKATVGLFCLVTSSACIAYENTVLRKFDFSGKTDLEISTDDSDVIYLGEDRDTVAVEVKRIFHRLNEEEAQEFLSYLILDFEESEDGLSIDTQPDFKRQHWNGMRYSQQVIIHGPRQIDITARIEDGDLRLESIEGSVTIRLEDGNLKLESIVGSVELSLDDGSVRGSQLSGESNFDVEDGNVSLAQFSGQLTAKLEDGNMDVEFSDTPSDDCQIDLEDGRLKLRLPESIQANLILEIDEGKVKLGNLGSSVLMRSDSKKQVFALNGGGVEIAIKVEDGNVDVN